MATEPAPVPPPSVRLLRGGASWLVAHRRIALRGALGLAALSWLASGVFLVGNGEQAAVRRFGRLLDDAVGPGLHVTLPAGIDAVETMRTGEVRRIEVGGEDGEPIGLVTGDENLIEATLIVQYKVTDLGRFLFGAERPANLLASAVRAAFAEEVARRRVDDLLTVGKALVQTAVRRRAQERLKAWKTGVSLVSVSLQRIAPPSEAAPAFRAVSDARAGAARAENLAETERERSVALAQGEASRRLQEAESRAAFRKKQAEGAAARFQALLAQERRSPGLTRADLYLRTVRKVFPRLRIVVLAPGQAPSIDVNLTAGSKKAASPPIAPDSDGPVPPPRDPS